MEIAFVVFISSTLPKVTYLLNECTATTINHQDVRRFPSLSFLASRIALGSINVRVTKVTVGVVYILCNGATVGRDTKKRFTMVIPFLLEETVGDLQV
jgi:hypothetical protein